MTVLYVAEFSQLVTTPNGIAAMALQSPLAEQTMSITASSTTLTNPFNSATKFIRVHTDSICSIKVGGAPVATTSTARMAANQTEYFGVAQNSGWNIAVITNT